MDETTPVLWWDVHGEGGFPQIGAPHAVPGDLFRDAEGLYFRLMEDLTWERLGHSRPPVTRAPVA